MLLGSKLKIVPCTGSEIFSRRKMFPVVQEFPSVGKSMAAVKCSLTTSINSPPSYIEKIRERVKGYVEISPSAYDTAWVAMVSSGGGPCFPACLDWIIQNQNKDGSWGLNPGHPDLVKDSLSCTLACLIALRKWKVSEATVQKGLEFIRSNSWAATDKAQISPLGFDIVFPQMIKYAEELNLVLPFTQESVDSMFRNRELEIERSRNLEYIAEGVDGLFDRNNGELQRSNASISSSPAAAAAAAAAAALMNSHDNNSLEYLQSVLQVFKTWVPTIHPSDIFARLSMIDTFQRMGIDRHMQTEIDTVLEDIYRSWQQKEEQIFAHVSCLAMAFRILRMKGYDVSPDKLAQYAEEETYLERGSLERTDVAVVLELYRASQVRVDEEEDILDRINVWTTKFLKQELINKTILDKKLQKQVEFELKNFHGILDRVGHRRSMELYDPENYQILKAAYRFPAIYNEEILLFSRQDFNSCQAQHQKELELLERWYYKDCMLDSMEYGRNVLRVAHFLTSAMMADPKQAHARSAFAKHIVLVTRLDDFFDHHGSREDCLLIIDLIREWNDPSSITYGNKEVEILYTAVFKTITELAETAYPIQGRDITGVLTHLWVDILTSFVKEMDSLTDETAPTMEEYLSFAWVSIGCKICILICIHFLGVKFSEEVLFSSECTDLCRHVSCISRLMNDIQTFEKERQERKLNSVSLQLLADKGSTTDEEASLKVRNMVEHHRRKLLQLVLQTEGSIVPKECKQVFWMSGKIGYYLYSFVDEFTSPQQMKEDMISLIFKPLQLPPHAT